MLLLLLISCSYFQYYYSKGCHEEERRTLLEIKDSFNKTESYKLSTWVGKNCCTWDGIECNNFTSRVERLDLMDVRQGDANAWYPNATLFNSFKELKWLNLHGNQMGGNGTELLQVVCQFNLIEHLNVGLNSLEGVVPPCLGNLTSLTYLDLSRNQFQGNIPSLSRLDALETLIMSHNQFEGNNILHLFGENWPIQMQDASNFSNATIYPPWKNLRWLDLCCNGLVGDGLDLAQVVCPLSLLEVLYIDSNSLEGVVPPCLGNLTSLEALDLSHNQFQGNISYLSRLNALEILDLSHNQFQGNISSVSRLNDIETLDLSHNQFQGNILHLFGENHPIRMQDASNFSNATMSPPWKKLHTLALGFNEFTGDGWDLAQVVCQLSLLEILIVDFTSLEGVVPPCLGNLTSITFLDLSFNKFHGNIPAMDKMTALENLFLSNNEFEGDILNLFGKTHSFRDMSSTNGNMSSPLTELKFLDLSNNALTGDGWDPFQAICQFKSLAMLSLSQNLLEGRLHPCLGMMHSIRYLDLSYNRFQGNVPPIPDGFNMNKSSLVYLDLSSNRLEGDILARDSNMSELRFLKLQNNSFTRLTTLPRLLILVDLRYNHLSGDIYSDLLSLPHLRVLLFGENHLEGNIPKQLCEMELLQLIDLSHNNLSGKIPSCLNNISSMRDKYRVSNEGPIVIGVTQVGNYTVEFSNHSVTADFTTKGNSYPYVGDPLTFMTGIDLSCNQLTGDIPSEIGDLRNLHALNLSNNRLTGSLPTSFKNMESLESLDLSCNELSGTLPLQLTQLHLLSVFNVSFNNLSGSIPFNQQFSTFQYDYFVGNVGLCGTQVKRKCSPNTTLGHNPPQRNFDNEDEATSLIENRLFFYSWVAIHMLSDFGLLLALLFSVKSGAVNTLEPWMNISI